MENQVGLFLEDAVKHVAISKDAKSGDNAFKISGPDGIAQQRISIEIKLTLRTNSSV